VASKKKYIERLAMVVEHLHKCAATHRATVPVHEIFRGQTVWQGDVEVFDIKDHPKAKRAYGWSHRDGPDDPGRAVCDRAGGATGRICSNCRTGQHRGGWEER